MSSVITYKLHIRFHLKAFINLKFEIVAVTA